MIKNKTMAFTLAEVLITLGIIGVVAAMTLPNLVANYKKNALETKLQKFYSVMNQAILQSEIDNGDKRTWIINNHLDSEKKDLADNMAWYNQYLANYLKVLRVEKTKEGYVAVYFPDGSAFILRRGGSTYNYFPDANKLKEYPLEEILGQIHNPNNDLYGRNCFMFALMPNNTKETGWERHKGKGVEPYKWWDVDKEEEIGNWRESSYGCSNTGSKIYCAALIQQNGWKIPKDYPIKF